MEISYTSLWLIAFPVDTMAILVLPTSLLPLWVLISCPQIEELPITKPL
jgi:hypothetical protein